jgi:IS6 family transposase
VYGERQVEELSRCPSSSAVVFPVKIILLCVRWYCKYGITYRDLAEMMQGREVEVDASTIFWWVQRYAPELEKRIRWYQGYRSPSLRVDATYAGATTSGESHVTLQSVEDWSRLAKGLPPGFRIKRHFSRFTSNSMETSRMPFTATALWRQRGED